MSDDEWNKSYNEIKLKHDSTFIVLKKAIEADEALNTDLALINYKHALDMIDTALTVPVSLPDDPSLVDNTWQEACEMIQKLKRSRPNVLQRIVILTRMADITGASCSTEPKAKDESEVLTGKNMTYSELAKMLKEMQCTENMFSENDQLELLFSCDGCKFYHISVDGEVVIISDDSTLRIINVTKPSVDEQMGSSTFFLQVIKTKATIPITDPSTESNLDAINEQIKSDLNKSYDGHIDNDTSWLYPLVAGVSPCYRDSAGAYIFPDLKLSNGSAIGLMVPNGPNEIVLEILEAILHGIVKEIDQLAKEDGLESKDQRLVSDTVSENIVKGACYISDTLVCGSKKFGNFLNYSTPYLISKLNKAPEHTPPVSDKVVTGVEIAKSATGIAVGITGYVAERIGWATMALGRYLAPHIQNQGSKLLSHTTGMSNVEAQQNMTGLLTVAAGAVEGFGTIYEGLEKSASILGNNISNNSVKIIEHKYGPSAGTLASGSFDTVGNLINLNQNVNYMTPKGLVKKTAKYTGKGIVQNFQTQNLKYVPASNLYLYNVKE